MISDRPMKKVTLSLDPDSYYRFCDIVRRRGSDPSKAIRSLIRDYLLEAERRMYEKLGREHEAKMLPDIELTEKELEIRL